MSAIASLTRILPFASSAFCSAFAAASPLAVFVRSHWSHVYVLSPNSFSARA